MAKDVKKFEKLTKLCCQNPECKDFLEDFDIRIQGGVNGFVELNARCCTCDAITIMRIINVCDKPFSPEIIFEYILPEEDED